MPMRPRLRQLFHDLLKPGLKETGLHCSRLYRTRLSPAIDRIIYELDLRLKRGQRPPLVADVRPLARQRGWNLTVHHPAVIQQREASRTIVEDLKDILLHGRRRVAGFDQTPVGGSRARAEMYFSHLYAVTRYPVHETFTCEIPGAMVLSPSGVVITPQFEMLAQSIFGRPESLRPPIVKGVPAVSKSAPGRYVSLLHSMAKNYAHWFMDCLPRLSLLDYTDEELMVMVPCRPASYKIDSLKLLGIPERRIVSATQPEMVVEKLVLCHAAQRSGVPHAAPFMDIRDRLVAAVAGSRPQRPPERRVYISRAKSARKVVNEAELLPVLRNFHFEVAVCEDLSLAQQIELFSDARVVLGPHGAGIINQIFCQPGATVIEIYNRRRWEHCTCRVASLMNHRHWHIFGENRGGYWDTWVNPRKLEKVLEYALEDNLAVDRSMARYDSPY